MYVLKKLRLKDPELIKRWEKLAAYARTIPAAPQKTFYTSVLETGWAVAAFRDRRDASMIFFVRGDEEDLRAVEEVAVGQLVQPIHVEYKVSVQVPFVIRHMDYTTMVGTKDGLDLAEDKKHQGVRAKVRILRTAFTTDAYIPSAEELDELLAFLEHARPWAQDA